MTFAIKAAKISPIMTAPYFTMATINLRLTTCRMGLFLALFSAFLPVLCRAAENAPAAPGAPPPAVSAPATTPAPAPSSPVTIATPSPAKEAAPEAPLLDMTLGAQTPVVVELFSSQACIFCPRADRFFSSLIKNPHIIGLACHINYFDVVSGSLARPFCTARQAAYMDVLSGGPSYTPEIVVQGQKELVGYRTNDISAAISAAAAGGVLPLGIQAAPAKEAGDTYILTLPEGAAGDTVAGTIVVAVYDRPHTLTVADGRNKGQKMVYYNIVSALDHSRTWPAGQKSLTIKQPLAGDNAGFAVLIQDLTSGKISAAGKFEPQS